MKKVNKFKHTKCFTKFIEAQVNFILGELSEKRKNLIKEVKKQIFKDQGGICAYCEQDFPVHKEMMTI